MSTLSTRGGDGFLNLLDIFAFIPVLFAGSEQRNEVGTIQHRLPVGNLDGEPHAPNRRANLTWMEIASAFFENRVSELDRRW